ncbi:MAG: c-type cytochrome [Proteobacteria bacterium]|nr:c-type cytochrome [Pseudomonadota bacterium]
MTTKSIFYQCRIAPLKPFVLFAAFAAFLIASTASAQQTNPLASDPRAAQAGGVIFRGQCATCHGADAKGLSSIDAPDLTLMWTQPGMSEDRVFTRIQAGVPGSIMPPHNYPNTEIWMLVSYLRSVAVTGSIEEFTGDENSGARLFTAHCSECHRAGISGGSLGPNLELITLRRSQAALRSSVREPSSSISRGYKPIILSTSSAPNVSGIIKGEDAFSIQILDSNQRLRGFVKSDLLSQDRDIDSLMPAFTEEQLSDSQLDDILSYLHQQR